MGANLLREQNIYLFLHYPHNAISVQRPMQYTLYAATLRRPLF